MVSGVWIGSKFAAVIWQSGNTATETQLFSWLSPGAPEQGLTVSAQAALSGFGYAVEPAQNLPFGTATAKIFGYRVAGSANVIPVGEPTLNNVQNVFEIVFELTVTAFAGAGTGVEATMVGTVFIQ